MKLEQIRNIEVNHLKTHNMMQIELARRMFGSDMTDEKFGEWAKVYSVDFRLTLDNLVDENPNIMDEWEVEENRDGILLKIEERLYGKDGEKIKFSNFTSELDVNQHEKDGESVDRTDMV